jgi:hypothetical protein
VPGFGFVAFTCTPSDRRRLVRLLLFQNDGTCVAKSVVGVEVVLGYRTAVLNVPSTMSLLVLIDATRPASSWLRK